MNRFLYLAAFTAVILPPLLPAQALYVPNGTSGIGFSSNGNVGLGVSNPGSKLESNGMIRVMGSATPTTNGGGLELSFSGGASIVESYNRGVGGVPLYLYGYPTSFLGGNVGIGITTPSSKLDVRGDIRAYRDGSDTINPHLYFANEANNRAWNWQLSATGESAFWGYDGSSWSEKIRIDFSGNVGIGTTSPTHKLSVNGSIRAKEVIVDTGWADYVFAEDYHLAPLSEVEAHIAENGHLPNVPSARDVAARGVNLGDFQTTLLTKVEELTLHLIAQEKRIAALEAENALLKGNR